MRPHKGFSLLEILVAFAIMAVALTIVLRVFGSGVNTAVISEEYNFAVQIAESLMAKAGVETPIQAGVVTGTEADKYQWQISVASVAQMPTSKDQTQEQQAVPQLWSVKVRVNWGDEDGPQRVVELKNLKMLLGQN